MLCCKLKGERRKMNTKLLVAIMASILLIGIFVTAVSIKPAKADYSDAIYIDPSSTNKNPGDSFFDVYVDVSIDPARAPKGLFGFDIKITWGDDSLITFSSLDKTPLDTIWSGYSYFEPLTAIPPYMAVQSGPGWVRYAAVEQGGSGYTGTGHLFKLTFNIVKSCNFVLTTTIHFETVKLSDPDGEDIAAIPTDGLYTMSATTPDLEFEYHELDIGKPIEYCKHFEVKVYVTHICAQLEDYTLVIAYDSSLLKLTGVDWTGGVLVDLTDPGHYTEDPQGTITVIDTGDSTYTGLKGLLFTLTFHVEFIDTPEHIWRTNNLGPLHAFIKFNDATLSFVEGTWHIGINMPPDLDIVVNLIQGDVNCDGKVNVMDLTTVAALYDQTVTPDIAKYNLKATDNVINLYDLVKVATNFFYGW
jgi:hypothetical protein